MDGSVDGTGPPGEGGLEASVVSPSGDAVAFRRSSGPDAGLYCYAVPSGTCSRLGTEADLGPTADHLAWTADGTGVLYHRRGGVNGTDLWVVDRDGTVGAVIDGAGSFLLTDVGPDQLLYLDRNGFELFRLDREAGTHVAIRTDDASVYGATFDPGGDRIAYTASGADRYDQATVYLTDLDGEHHTAVPVSPSVGVRDWAPGGGLLLEVDSMTAAEQNIGWVPIPAEGCSGSAMLDVSLFRVGSERCIEHPLGWLPDGRILAERRTREATLVPVLYDRTGKTTVVPVPPGVADFAGEGYGATLADGRLAVEGVAPGQPRRGYAFDPTTADLEVLIDPGEQIDGTSPASVTHHVVRTADGTTVGAIRAEPHHGEPPYPVVILVPDRPQSQAWQGFHSLDQRLLAHGIGVVRVNQRGAAAYLGEPTSLEGGFGADDQTDVAAVADWLAGVDGVDQDRIAIAGRHYGGYTTVLQLCRDPDRYSCGVAWGAIADLTAFCADETAGRVVVGTIERWLDSCGPETWAERSPIASLDELSAPVGLLHRIDDQLVPIDQTERIRHALDERGWTLGNDYEYRRVTDDRAGERFVAEFLASRLFA